MPRATIVDWPQEAIDYITTNYGTLSAREIANSMPGDRVYSRSAVVGKAARLGLTSDLVGGGWGGKGVVRRRGIIKPIGTIKRVPNPMGGKLALVRTSVAEQAMGAPRFKQVELTEPVLDLPNLWCEPVGLQELTEDTCRWPLDGGKYCGLRPWKANPYGASPYCVAHHRLGHRSVAEHTRLRPRT